MSAFGLVRSPRTILFGRGQRRAIGEAAGRLGSRALLCTDARLADDPALDDAVSDLRAAGVEVLVYAETVPDLPVDCILACAGAAEVFAPEFVVGLGGGSCVDLAKMAALLLTHGGGVQDYYGENAVPGPVLPVVAVPTTAGTGSEATPVAVVSDPDRTLKVGVSSPFLIPEIAICDPALTDSCPPGLTAYSGADALTHAVEAFTAVSRPADAGLAYTRVFVGKNRLSDLYAREAVALVAGSLADAVAGGVPEARDRVMLASLLAGCAFGVAGTSAAHALQYPVGALTHTPHGLGVATLLPYAMRFNRTHCRDELATLGRILAPGAAGDDDALAGAAIAAVERLWDAIGIPRTVADLGFPRDRIGWAAEQAMTATRLVGNNPRPLDAAGLEEILASAFGDESAEGPGCGLARQQESRAP